MIVTDRKQLEIVSVTTNYEYCVESGIFNILIDELSKSKVSGIGLSAIQVGYAVRALFISPSRDTKRTCAMNAIITKADSPIIWTGEGCLSDPGKYYNTDRYNKITVEYIDFPSNKKVVRDLEGFEAVVWAHEVDHTLGICNYMREHYKTPKIGRNESCKCGSGLKYKKCCLGKENNETT